MSISLDKLKALRKQAGHVDKAALAPSSALVVDAAASPASASSATTWDARDSSQPDSVATSADAAVVDASPPSAAENATISPIADVATPPLLAHGDTAARAQQPPPAPRETSVFGWVEQIQHKAVAAPRAPAATSTRPAVRRPQDGDVLRRLLATRKRAAGAPLRAEPAGPVDRELPGSEIAPGLHLIEAFLPQPIPAQPLSLAFSKRPDEAVAPHDLLFFDTETTGLAGGTGTRAFMVGAADWHHDTTRGDGLRVRQLLMATMAAESAMLELFASWLAPSTVLSSYNGRCYDAPLLKTRYRLARKPDPLSVLDHVDLLFPTRRRYRGTWENCRLGTIERQLLQIAREDDLPGSEAPAAWLGYLRGGSARNLRRVGEHNHQDVVTLAQLFLRLVEEQRNDDCQRELEAAGSSAAAVS
jgi:uncharacterized protein YprB with RNaseH-like and TPR domain